MTVNNLQDRTFKYALSIIKLIKELEAEKVSYILINQLLRSGTSVGANVSEAKAASSRRDFTNYYTHALKSANESKYWLDLIACSKYNDNIDLSPVLKETKEIANILAACILSLKNKRAY